GGRLDDRDWATNLILEGCRMRDAVPKAGNHNVGRLDGLTRRCRQSQSMVDDAGPELQLALNRLFIGKGQVRTKNSRWAVVLYRRRLNRLGFSGPIHDECQCLAGIRCDLADDVVKVGHRLSVDRDDPITAFEAGGGGGSIAHDIADDWRHRWLGLTDD